MKIKSNNTDTQLYHFFLEQSALYKDKMLADGKLINGLLSLFPEWETRYSSFWKPTILKLRTFDFWILS